MQIENYRTRLEQFEENLNRELYLYYSGQKERLEILGIYSDYSDLFSSDSICEVESEMERTSALFQSRRKSLGKIAEFLIDQYLDCRLAPVTQEILNFEAKQTLSWEGRGISIAQARNLLKKEPDAIKRRRLHERLNSALGESETLREKSIAQLRSAAEGLRFENYVKAGERISGVQYTQLLSALDTALRPLEDRYMECLRESFETSLGIPLQEAGAWDVPYWEKKNDIEQVFSGSALTSAIEATVAELGIQPERPGAIELDLDRRALKQAEPMCIPIRVPYEIKIVMLPEDGSKHYAALLHETGHASHLAWTSASLPFEHRIWGDRALSESYAFLFEHFLMDPLWLMRALAFTTSKDFLRFQSLCRLFLIRRCAGKLHFALKLHERASLDGIPQIYSEVLKAYTGLPHLPESWRNDCSDGFYAAHHLRGWVLEAMLREHLRTRYGSSWSTNRSAAGFLKEIWETGQLYRADELSREIGIGDLDPQILADDLLEGLRY